MTIVGRDAVLLSSAARLVVFSLRFVRMIVLKPSVVFDVVDAFAGVLNAIPWCWLPETDVSM